MTIRRIAATATIALCVSLTGASAAPYLQPEMRTMIQQGGVEGTVLGDIFGPPVVYVPVYVPAARTWHGAGIAPRRRSLAQRHRPYAHRGRQYITAR